MADWTADEIYVMEGTGALCTISGRTFYKVNSGKALVATFYQSTGYTGPLLVSTDPDAVTYSALGANLPYVATVEYLGLTWYCSNTGYFMGGNCSTSGYAKKLPNVYADSAAAALALIEIAHVQLIIEYLLKYLILSSGTYYNILNGELNPLSITEISANVFETYGNDNTPDSNLLKTLSNPSVLCWTNAEDEIHKINASVVALPFSQTVISEKIDLSSDSIKGIENVTVNCEGNILIAVSFDNKKTWKAWNGSSWIVLSDDFSGMSKDSMESITIDQWSEIFDKSGDFYIRVVLSSSDQSVTEIRINFIN